MTVMATTLSRTDRAALAWLRDRLRRATDLLDRLLGDDLDIGDRDDVAGLPVPDGVECWYRTDYGRSYCGAINSPAGYASTERRTRQVPGRPGSKQSPTPPGVVSVGDEGVAGLRGPATPATPATTSGGVR